MKKRVNEKELVENKIKAIIFDVGGVLQLPKYSIFRMRGGHSGVHESMAEEFQLDLDSWFDSIDTAYAMSIEGKIGEIEAVKTIAKNLGTISINLKKLFAKAYKKYFKRNNKLYKIVDKLNKKGYITGILSDQWAISNKALISKEDRKKFNVIIISNEIGLRKPNIKIYKLLMEKLRKKDKTIKPSEVLFIDNREWNLKPARKLGIKVILFENNTQCIRELEMLGVI